MASGYMEFRVGPESRLGGTNGITTGSSWLVSSLPVSQGSSAYSSLVISGAASSGTVTVHPHSYIADSFSNATFATSSPTTAPTRRPTLLPTRPTLGPSPFPTAPTSSPSSSPTSPSVAPSASPTAPTAFPTALPSATPSASPSEKPTKTPSGDVETPPPPPAPPAPRPHSFFKR
jgi:hypothetical protein